MKAPSDKALRATVQRWTKAHIRWMEFVLADVGSPRYRVLLDEATERRHDANATTARLAALGMRLLLATGKKVKHGKV